MQAVQGERGFAVTLTLYCDAYSLFENGVDASSSFARPLKNGKIKQDTRKTRRASTVAGNVLAVHDQDGAERNAVFRRGFFILLDGAGAQLAFNLRQLNGNDLGNTLFLHGNTEESVCLIHGRLTVSNYDELRIQSKTL